MARSVGPKYYLTLGKSANNQTRIIDGLVDMNFNEGSSGTPVESASRKDVDQVIASQIESLALTLDDNPTTNELLDDLTVEKFYFEAGFEGDASGSKKFAGSGWFPRDLALPSDGKAQWSGNINIDGAVTESNFA